MAKTVDSPSPVQSVVSAVCPTGVHYEGILVTTGADSGIGLAGNIYSAWLVVPNAECTLPTMYCSYVKVGNSGGPTCVKLEGK